MLFNTIDFAIFLPIVFILYWFVTNYNLRLQNFLIVVASFVFYGWWDWRFLSLITFSSLVDFVIGLTLLKENNLRKRKYLLATSIIINLGLLAFFKYFNFFIDNFVEAFSLFGKHLNKTTLNIILPVGISFYTFQTLSYGIDVYRKKLTPTKDIISFFAFVSFFPQLVAGPIERAANLLPQFYKKRVFNLADASDGFRQILWGLFKKIVIADNSAVFVNDIFLNYADKSGPELVLGAVFFAFQIYGDFSGYSDIAIGTAKLFGFRLMQNFAFPYFSRDIAEFWRRWHISLSTWFRDYLYIPLGGSKGGIKMKIRNTFAIFIVSGFWHGANWTFVFWGALNAIYFLPLLLLNKNRKNTDTVAQGKFFPNIKEFFQVLFTFFLTTIAWIFFRSKNITQAFDYIKKMFVGIFKSPQIFVNHSFYAPYFNILLMISILIIMEWLKRDKQHALQFDNVDSEKRIFRWGAYLALLIVIFIFGVFDKTEFIYFAF